MNRSKSVLSGLLCLLFLCGLLHKPAFALSEEPDTSEPDKLLVVWTSGDKDVAKNMVFMYTFNAKRNGWWNRVQFLVWGASTKLLSEDQELQDYLKKMKEAGVELFACKACADIYGVSETLTGLGIDVKYMGVPLTAALKKSDWVTITF
jgi:hypothetical protein